jgi:Domain of unknown function (DUF4129)
VRAALAALLVAIGMLAPSFANAQPATDAAREALTQAALAVESASRAPEGERGALVATAVAALESSPDLSRNDWLREPLTASPPDLAKARARLAAATSAAASAQPARDPAGARSALADVLAMPAFQEHDWTSAVPSWLLPAALLIKALLEFIWNAMRWPLDRLWDLITRIVGDVLRGPVVLLLALAVVAGLVLLYQRGLRSAIVRQAEIRQSDQPLPPTAGEALALAARHSGAGRYREACHFVLLSTLLAIEERGHTRFDPSATNREHLARLAGLPQLARALGRVVARFDHIWYGQDAASEADYRELLSLATGVSEAAA